MTSSKEEYSPNEFLVQKNLSKKFLVEDSYGRVHTFSPSILNFSIAYRNMLLDVAIGAREDELLLLFKANKENEEKDKEEIKRAIYDLDYWLYIHTGLSGEPSASTFIPIPIPENHQYTLVERGGMKKRYYPNKIDYNELPQTEIEFFDSLKNPDDPKAIPIVHSNGRTDYRKNRERYHRIANLLNLADYLNIPILVNYGLAYFVHEISNRTGAQLREDSLVINSRYYTDPQNYEPFPFSEEYLKSGKLEKLRAETLESQ